MKITVIGSGVVGQTVTTKLQELGHDVTMATRNPNETKNRTEINQMTGKSFADWYKDNSSLNLTNFEASTKNADLVINATSGGASVEALKMVGASDLEGKVVLDIANPLDFSNGMPPTLSVCNTDSLAEQIQQSFPKSKVVKSLNTMNAFLMTNPESLPGKHHVFVSGNDEDAKLLVSTLLESIGWKKENILDLGDITTARGTEMLLPIWLRLWGALGHANFNFHIQQAPQ